MALHHSPSCSQVSALISAPSGRYGSALLVGGHDVGGLHPGHVVEVVVAAQQTGFQEGRSERAVGGQVLGQVDHVGHGVDLLQGREGAVQRADHVDRALCRPALQPSPGPAAGLLPSRSRRSRPSAGWRGTSPAPPPARTGSRRRSRRPASATRAEAGALTWQGPSDGASGAQQAAPVSFISACRLAASLGEHAGDLLAVEHHPVEGVAEDLVDLAAACAQAHR